MMIPDHITEHGETTVREFLEDRWLPTAARRLQPSTHESYERYLAVHVTPTLGHRLLGAVSPTELNDLYARLLLEGRRDGRPGGLSNRSVRYVHAIVHSLFRDAVRWDLITVNPADRADPPSARSAQAPEMKTWDQPTLATFLARAKVAGDPLYAAWVVLATTGLRRGELLGLRWSDIEEEARVLRVRRQVNLVRGEVVINPRTKSGKPRALDLDDHTIDALAAHRSSGPGTQQLIFARPTGEPLHPGRFSRAFARRISRYGMPAIRLHDLRHTWATLALHAGIDIKIVSDRLGHSSSTITWAVYQHVTPHMRTDAADRVANLIFGG